MEKQTGMEHTQQYIAGLVEKGKKAQKYFEHNYKNQRAVDEVVRAVGYSVVQFGDELAEQAVAETGMGNVQGKKMKMEAVALNTWNTVRGKASVGEIENTIEPGVTVLAKPLGIIGCVMPSTNPIATVIYNSMIALKCRNAVIIAPHPGSAKTSTHVTEIIRKGLAEIGAPVDLVQCISPEEASIDATREMLRQCDVNIATGGAGMVKSVYSAGRPAFGVGQGNCQEIIDEDWPEMERACRAAIGNRAMDSGVPCTGDQTMHVPALREQEYLDAMEAGRAYLLKDQESIDALRTLLFPDGERINRKIVGKSPHAIGELLGLDIPEDTPVILFKNQASGTEDVLCKEILCPIIRYRTYETFEEAVDASVANLEYEGAGHSSSIWSNHEDRIYYAADLIPVGRFHINQPTVGGSNGIMGGATIGCGSWGNNSISENLQYYHLMNKTKVSTVIDNKHKASAADWDNYDVCKVVED